MPRRRPNLAARWSSYQRRYRGTPGVTLAAPLSSITFPGTKLRGLVEIAPSADLTADPSTWSWVDITQWVRHDLGISTVVGRRDQASLVDPSRATLKLDNRDGRFSRRNPTGPYYGQLTRNTPIRIAVDPGDGMHYRYYGFVNEWPKRWDKSGNDSTVTITCGGILRRLQRSQPLRSAMFRSMVGVAEGDFVPVAYWSMEDGSEASSFSSGIVGHPPAPFGGAVTLSDYTAAVGSEALPTIGANGRITAHIPTYTDTGTWQMQFMMAIPSAPSGDADYMNIYTNPGSGSTIARIRVYYDSLSTDMTVAAYDSSGTLIDSNGTSPTYGSPLLWAVTQFQNAGNLLTVLSQYSASGSVSQTNIITAGAAGRVTRASATASSTNAGWSTGHWALYTDPAVVTTPNITPNAAGMGGHVGEQAHERIIRVCREERVPLRCVAGTSAELGPQPTGTILEVLRDAEKADLGVLYEHEFGLGYQALSERYGQPVQLALDVEAGHIGEPPEADDSDLRFRNQWTVKRTNGSERTVLSEDYDDTEGLYPGSTTVNVHTDDQLQHVAGWLVHRDTADEDYWTGLTLRFSRAPDMIPAWVSLPFGARMTVANPPSQADPGDIDAIVEGWSERWDQVSWQATLNTSPASTLEVPVWDDLGFLWDSGSSSLTSDITDSATSISVTTTEALDLWVEGAVDFDIEVGGEQMTVTNISGATSPQTFTVTRAVNGITKSHSAGDRVALWTPPIWGL